MSYHPYRQWPKFHRQLLQFSLALLALLLVVLWFHVLPRWQVLEERSEELEREKQTFENKSYPLDAVLLQQHLADCEQQLNGKEKSKGLIQLSKQTIEKATSTFQNDIVTAYPVEPMSQETPEIIFVNHASRIDFKDLFDRLNTSLSDEGITITPQSLGLDEESPEPVYQQILKLWTIRKLIGLASQNHLDIEENKEENAAAIRARRVIAYTLTANEEKPYLLEFPIRIRLSGTMKDFLSFVDNLQGPDMYLPMKRLIVHSTPPQSFPPGETKIVERLQFTVVCSSFFKIPEN
ncbi:MAG: hypothetical protein J6X55_12780 [Victivallales bacterium]|nr:hypothetical protein [Victivallales bacterium]